MIPTLAILALCASAPSGQLDEMITDLKILIPKATPAEKPEMMHRLAELLLEKYKQTSQSAHRRAATDLYARVLDDYPSYDRNDEILFNLGLHEQESGRIDRFWTLIKQFPRSRFIGDAYLQLGEYFFEHNDLRKARTAYERAGSTAKAQRTRDYARFKLAWCDFNDQDYAGGITKLQALIEAPSSDLRSEALAALPRFYARAGEVGTALAYFERHAPKNAVAAMMELGVLYEEQGAWKNAVEAYKRITDVYAGDPRAPEARVAIFKGYAKLDDRPRLLESAERLLEVRDAVWREAITTAIRDIATEYHAAAQRTSDPAGYRVARELYRYHLRLDPQDHAVRFFHAETAWALGDWREAALEYEQVARSPEARYARTAAYDAVLAREKLTRIRAERAAGQEAIPEPEQDLVRACDAFVAIAGEEHGDSPLVAFKAAYVYFVHAHAEEAIARYREIIRRWPLDPVAKKSAHLLLELLAAGSRWDELEREALALRSNQKLIGGDAELAGVLRRVLATSSLRAILVWEEKSELDRAIPAVEEFLREYSRTEFPAETERAHWLLAQFHERIADFEAAAERYSSFFDRYPQSKHAPDALFNAGVYYHGLGQRSKAIAKFSRYFQTFEESADAAEVYLRACELHEEAKDWKKAADCFGAIGDALPHATPARIFAARDRFARALERLGQKARALTVYRWLVGEYPRLAEAERAKPVARRAVAHTAFVLIEPEYRSYLAMAVTLNRNSVLAKAARAEELACVASADKKCPRVGKLVEIVEYGDPEYRVAALARIGKVYLEMADAIADAPEPAGLDVEQMQIYEAAVEAAVATPRTRALEAFERAYAEAHRFEVFAPFLAEAEAGMAALNPHRAGLVPMRPIAPAEVFVTAGVRE